MLAACKMNETEKKALVEVFNKQKEKKDDEIVVVCNKEHADQTPAPFNEEVANAKKTEVSLEKDQVILKPIEKEKMPKDLEGKGKVPKDKDEKKRRLDETENNGEKSEKVKKSNANKKEKLVNNDVKKQKTENEVSEKSNPKSETDHKKHNKGENEVQIDVKKPNSCEIKTPSKKQGKEAAMCETNKGDISVKSKEKSGDMKNDACDNEILKKSKETSGLKKPIGEMNDGNDRSEMKEVSTNPKDKLSKNNSEENPVQPEIKIKKNPVELDEDYNSKAKKKTNLIKTKSKQLARYTSKIVLKNKEVQNKLSNCNICEKVFKNEQKLLKHIGKEHPEVKTFKYCCRKCPSAYRTRTELKEHAKMKHLIRGPVTRAKLSPRSSPKTSSKSLLLSPRTSSQSSPSTSHKKKSPSESKIGSPSRNLKPVRGLKRLNDENSNETVAITKKGNKQCDSLTVEEDIECSVSDNLRSSKRAKVDSDSQSEPVDVK